MKKEEIKNLIEKLIEKTGVKLKEISITSDGPKNMWVSAEVAEPHFFISFEGEGLHALNHLVHRIIEKNLSPTPLLIKERGEGVRSESGLGIIIDINGFQKKHVENIRAIAHMMSERARYFKSNIEVDPMSAFERRIVHEFLSEATDLKTESTGAGHTRRVIIKYIGNL
ncbi:hypothetical protein A2643_00360 [Candidatus Nomurabacteria bacterium RIFCSPHIGHO2_01_FULL_39_220]|uniref:R3H domain-containing protein n=1 Tax=Candidatus Nomurabacteria bacterium RIFCSPLOWO2_02_FULL_40_67 TaxID=1801787 RepID=A0A1F6Y443_9BACT|nr:MAG: Single-stranded nucleic acid binding R3H [Parcubacteria group bacterium GW2011_GWA2_40_37]KKS11400.1 MAG: Single-stranded nucleic acid binding R3H [Parcubacteria group bacterium GW2011_GWB1_41_5]KKS71553.1 MAG: Single-stranded nucleic acid binding R3H [Parcubacteria group bacterium GW2011_GWF2_42_7]OGI62016.1 MAG: hypothetical protein A2W12_01500 [Candidatus Nomurabacteria bacterium RBG_16_40_11]OGI70229.1 MAG: hypothetical protein A2643_00360 [Candidatus Nomurabacteria bacterium RIFCSP